MMTSKAFLQVFEGTAQREEWLQANWPGIMAPFLMREAQQAIRDMAHADVCDYTKVKKAILARYGFSLPTRAQRFYQ